MELKVKKQKFRVGELSKYLGIGESTIWRYIKEGKLQFYKIGNKITILDIDEVTKALGLNVVEVA
jgi:excisionase family DNA binding protein